LISIGIHIYVSHIYVSRTHLIEPIRVTNSLHIYSSISIGIYIYVAYGYICVTNSPHRATPRVKNKSVMPSFYHTIIFLLLFLHNTRPGTAPPRGGSKVMGCGAFNKTNETCKLNDSTSVAKRCLIRFIERMRHAN